MTSYLRIPLSVGPLPRGTLALLSECIAQALSALHPGITGSISITMHDLFSEWYEQAEKLHKGEITKEEYDSWRYNFSEADLPEIHVKVTPSQELSDFMIRMSKEKGED